MPFNPIMGVGYTPLSRPQTYNDTDSGSVTNVGNTLSSTVTINRTSKVLGFLATATLTGLSAASQDSTVTLTKNGQTMSFAAVNGITALISNVMYENLGLLSGMEVERGDVFTITAAKTNGSGTVHSYTLTLTIIVQEV